MLRNVETMNYADIEKNINDIGLKVRALVGKGNVGSDRLAPSVILK